MFSEEVDGDVSNRESKGLEKEDHDGHKMKGIEDGKVKKISVVFFAFVETLLAHAYLIERVFFPVEKAAEGQSKNEHQDNSENEFFKKFSLGTGIHPVAFANQNEPVGDYSDWNEAVEEVYKEGVTDSEGIYKGGASFIGNTTEHQDAQYIGQALTQETNNDRNRWCLQ